MLGPEYAVILVDTWPIIIFQAWLDNESRTRAETGPTAGYSNFAIDLEWMKSAKGSTNMEKPDQRNSSRNAKAPKERLRIAIVTAGLGLAGAEKQAFYMACALAEAGADVRVYNLSSGGVYEAALRQLQIDVRGFGWLPGFPLRLLLLLAGLRRFRPHIIQSIHAFTNAYSAIAGKVLGAVSIGGLRSDLSACLADNGAFSQCLLTWPDAVAVNSAKASEQLKHTGLLDPSHVHLLPNAIDLACFPERVRLPAEAECLCLCVGRLFPLKRVDVFIRALAAARSIEPRLKGMVAGYGPEAERLRQLAAELGLLPGALTFLAEVDDDGYFRGTRDNITTTLQQASMFVFCSESEGTPNVILEAMAASLPVITTPAGDAGDIVESAGAGYVVPFGDVQAVANAMVRLAQSPTLRWNLGSAGRNYLTRHRATSELAGTLMNIYSDVVRTSRGGFRDKQFMMRLSGGFVIALHNIPPQRVADFVVGFSPARVIPLKELVQRRREGKSCFGLFAITVDDGVGDNVRALAQLFQDRMWPATFYLPTQYLDSGAPLAFQLWARLKPLLPRKKLELKSGLVDLSRPAAIEELSRKLEHMWYGQRIESYLPLTLELAEIVAREAAIKKELQGPAPIAWQEVTELSRDDLISFESHGVSHAAMSALTEEEIVFEMRHSQQVIEGHTGRPCRHLCYPFGSPLSIGTLAPKLARRFYDSATTMSLGPVDFADPCLLPRIPLYPTNSVRFAQMKMLLKCSVLNPSVAKWAWRKHAFFAQQDESGAGRDPAEPSGTTSPF
jgi:glycosyltransferase involved in cell wall biosynthesis/peptidoglycan/xylan/chitin deacetylase (PgdA/CDA1 family)